MLGLGIIISCHISSKSKLGRAFTGNQSADKHISTYLYMYIGTHILWINFFDPVHVGYLDYS